MRSASSLLSLVAVTLSLFASTSQADLTVSKRALKHSVTAFSPVERSLEESSEEGVFHLPLIKNLAGNVANTTSGLVRRGNGEKLAIDFDSLTFQVAVNGKPYHYQWRIDETEIIGLNLADSPSGWNPTKDPKAKSGGKKLTNKFDKVADPYEVESFSIGKTTLKGVQILYGQAFGDKPTPWTGAVGFGLPSVSTWRSGKPSFLESIYKSHSWAAPIFSTNFTPTGSPLLTLGAAPADTWWQPASTKAKGLWAVDIDIGGHKGVADLNIDDKWIVAPPEVASDLIKKAGLTPSTDGDGNIIGKLPCDKKVPQLDIKLGGGVLSFTSDAAAFPSDDGNGCIYAVKGVEQKNYPTPFTLGSIVFSGVAVAFDFTPGKARVGIADALY